MKISRQLTNFKNVNTSKVYSSFVDLHSRPSWRWEFCRQLAKTQSIAVTRSYVQIVPSGRFLYNTRVTKNEALTFNDGGQKQKTKIILSDRYKQDWGLVARWNKSTIRVLISVFDVFKSMWVFGYGSLIWKADFPFKIKVVGYIKGFKRRFYQHSVDHRGRPNKPGRVVTLIPSHPDDSVWGVAYEIYKRDESFVMAHLDYREKTGYKKQKVMFYPMQVVHNHRSEHGDGGPEGIKLEPFELMIYIGTEDNKWFAGPASIEEMAKQIYESEGPSGTNKEYLYNLANAMRKMAPHVNDEHLFGLEKAVRELEKLSKL